jgi:hypothetical protein
MIVMICAVAAQIFTNKTNYNKNTIRMHRRTPVAQQYEKLSHIKNEQALVRGA